MADRTHRDLSDDDVAHIADTYYAWKSENNYEDVAGFCKSTTIEEIRAQGYVLTPGRFVGAVEFEEDDEPFGEKIERITKVLENQFSESSRLEKIIRENLQKLDYGQ